MICQCGEPMTQYPAADILECLHCDRRHNLSLFKEQCSACVALDAADGRGPKTKPGKTK